MLPCPRSGESLAADTAVAPLGAAGAAVAATTAEEAKSSSGLGCGDGAGYKAVSSTSSLPSLNLVSRVLFPTPASSYNEDDFPGELIWVPRNLDPENCMPEECIPCLFLMSPSARFLIFYLHSNAEDLGRCYPFLTLLRYQFQVHVLAVEYPGYGLCPGGQADEESVTANAFVAFRFIREVLGLPLDGIIILGRSVGTGPALAVAMQQEVYGVVLISPFLSVQEVCKDVLGPLGRLIPDSFPNKDRVPMLRSPLLIVHGKRDVVVPVSHGEKLYHSCRSRKRLVCPDEMQHNTNLHADANFFVLPMLQFFSLPDYSFEELKVPLWAYDKRLCIHHDRGPVGPSFCNNGAELPDTGSLQLGLVPKPLVKDVILSTASGVPRQFPARSNLQGPSAERQPSLSPKRIDTSAPESPEREDSALIESALTEAVAKCLSSTKGENGRSTEEPPLEHEASSPPLPKVENPTATAVATYLASTRESTRGLSGKGPSARGAASNGGLTRQAVKLSGTVARPKEPADHADFTIASEWPEPTSVEALLPSGSGLKSSLEEEDELPDTGSEDLVANVPQNWWGRPDMSLRGLHETSL